MKNFNPIAAALDPSLLLKARGIEADPWQRELLFSKDRQVLLNCRRQSGKSTVVSALALHTTLYTPGSLTVILSPAQRQSIEVFHKVLEAYNAIDRPIKAEYETQLNLQLTNGSRVICLPGNEETVRCYTPDLLIIDEASRVPDALYSAMRPSLAVSNGRLIALSTPNGQKGWFYEEWQGDGPWKKVKVIWAECPRISEAQVREDIRALGQAYVDQEYNCLFTALEGLVYPDFERCHVDTCVTAGNSMGGIDWGWRNPFAAVWGVLDRDDVLWIQNERYLRNTPLHEHIQALPKIMWYADPSGAVEIAAFRHADHKVRKGDNNIRFGIAAVNARIRTGRLNVNPQRCPNLASEAKLYRYADATDGNVRDENPIDEHNHALGALRYLISRIDARFMAQLSRSGPPPADGPLETGSVEEAPVQKPQRRRSQMDINDPNLWTIL